MASSELTNSRRALHLSSMATFGDAVLAAGVRCMWWPSAAGGTDYLQPVLCLQPPPRRQSAAMAGLLTMATDEVIFHCDPAALPFLPRPQAIFIVAEAEAIAGDPVTWWPAEAREKYSIERITGGSAGMHLRLHCQLH